MNELNDTPLLSRSHRRIEPRGLLLTMYVEHGILILLVFSLPSVEEPTVYMEVFETILKTVSLNNATMHITNMMTISLEMFLGRILYDKGQL